MNNNNSEQWRLRDTSTALSKLLELRVKLVRHESLLRNLYVPSLAFSHLLFTFSFSLCACVTLSHDSDVYGGVSEFALIRCVFYYY